MTFDVSLVASGHDVADARIHKIVTSLTSCGLNVQVWGLGQADQGPAGAAVHVSVRGGFLRRALRSALLPWRADGRVLITVDPDTVPSAWLATRIRRRQLVVDVHEDYARLLRDRPWAHGPLGMFARALVALSSRSAAMADLTVVADDHLPPFDGHQRLVVRNAPEWALLPQPTMPDPIPRAIYIGDVRASRGLFDMLSAISDAPGWQLDIVGPVASADAAGLAAGLERGDLADRVRCHGRLKPAAAWELARGAWVGLALLHDTPAFRDAVPTKLDEYFATGLPVIVSDLPRPAAIVQRSGAGAVVHSPVEAAAFLRALVNSPVLLQKMRDAASVRRAALSESRSPYAELATNIMALLERQDHGQQRYGQVRPS